MKFSSSFGSIGLALIAAALTACVETNPKEPATIAPKVTAPSISVDPSLLHRFSFTSDAKDSVGSVNGTLKGSAKISGGQLVLDGDSKASSDDTIPYLEFSGPILPKEGNASIAVWFTCSEKTGDRAPRILDIGDRSGAVGDAFLYFTPHFTSTSNARAKISSSDSASGTPVDVTPALDDGKSHLVVITLDNTQMHVYVDGKEPSAAASFASNTLENVRQVHNWIGRSGFDQDNGINGSVDEVRTYSRALRLADVQALEKAGPNKLP